jgi:hypothetical protein
MTIPFERLPDHLKPKAAPENHAGRDWYYYGSRVETLGEEELKRWIPSSDFVAICGEDSGPNPKEFGGICETDSATSRAPASGNDSTSGMMKIADVCKYPEGGIQRLKRKRADILLAARPDLSDRELARLAGTSHTFISKRRRVATNPPTT